MVNIENYNFAGKRVIVRVDFNVPLDDNGKITDDTRIKGALPTLKKILADGGSLIIMSHMGKPKGKVNPKYSLSQIKDAVAQALDAEVKFAPDCGKASEEAAALKPGEVLLLENLRFYPEEEGKPVGIEKEDPAYEDAKKEMKQRQKDFAKTLASYADVYVNDAFGTAHRKHASTAVIADYFDADHKMLGYLMEKEVNAVDNVLSNIKRPFTAIMGGSKVSTKIGIIENLMDKVDNLILCGGMTYTFSKARGGKIGLSICEDDKLDLVTQKLCELGATKIIPFESDFTVAKPNPNKIARLNKVSEEACKQCGRSIPLKVENAISFKQMLEQIAEYDIVLFANEKERLASQEIQDKNNIAIIIGSEGGFSDSEIEQIKSRGAKCIGLGERILRTETASIALCAIVGNLIKL